jgi:hypothetical protein
MDANYCSVPLTSAMPYLVPSTHLKRLEADSVHIMREVAAEFRNPVLLYSIGKDSSVLLHLALKAFYPADGARERGAAPFLEVFVDTALEECMRRDPKKLYAKAKAREIQNFTGFDSPYEPPGCPDIRLAMIDSDPKELSGRLWDELQRRRILSWETTDPSRGAE